MPRGYCAKHVRPSARAAYDSTTRKDNPALALAARIRSSAQWQQVRALYRAQHPLCCDPFGLHGKFPAAMSDVHHVQGIAEAPHLAYVWSNLRSLCRDCHNRTEARIRAKKGVSGVL